MKTHDSFTKYYVKRKRPDYLAACKSARRFIHQNPGCTAEQLIAASSDHIGTLGTLQAKRLVRFEDGGKKGPAKWFVIPQ
jgi:hypothetical protein